MIDGDISFGYDADRGENVWTIPFTATKAKRLHEREFVFEVYASNVHFEYNELGYVNGATAPASYVYLDGCDVQRQLDGLVGQGSIHGDGARVAVPAGVHQVS